MENGRLKSIVAMLACAVVLSGCAGVDRARLPGEPRPPQEVSDSGNILAVGDKARVVLKSGEEVVGEVKQVSSESVTLGKNGNYGYVETEILARDIVFIESGEGTSVGEVSMVVGVGLVITGVVFIAALMSTGLN